MRREVCCESRVRVSRTPHSTHVDTHSRARRRHGLARRGCYLLLVLGNMRQRARRRPPCTRARFFRNVTPPYRSHASTHTQRRDRPAYGPATATDPPCTPPSQPTLNPTRDPPARLPVERAPVTARNTARVDRAQGSICRADRERGATVAARASRGGADVRRRGGSGRDARAGGGKGAHARGGDAHTCSPTAYSTTRKHFRSLAKLGNSKFAAHP